MGGLYDGCCFQWEIAGKHYFAKCGLLVCSTGIIDVLILMGNYWCAEQELIIFSNGNYWLALWKIIMYSTGHCWCAQQQIIGVHTVMGVSNIPNVRPGVICMPFKSTFSHV